MALLKEKLDHLIKLIPKTKLNKPNFGNVKEKLIVEFGSPNIAKPLHMGHLRSTCLGHYIARICQKAGHQVSSVCFLGDWGTQFGILQAGLAKYNNETNDLKNIDLHSLLQIYVRASNEKEVNEEFAKESRKYSSLLEEGDPVAVSAWSIVREKTIEHLKGTWSKLGIDYNVIQSESQFSMDSCWTKKVLNVFESKNLTSKESDGSIFVTVPSKSRKNETLTKIPIVKNDGSSLYILRDIAAALERSNSIEFDRMIYVVDKSQQLHFSNLFNLLENFNFESYDLENSQAETKSHKKKLQYVSFGKIEGMSTRSGTFVLLSDAIHECTKIMNETRTKSIHTRWNEEEVSYQLAVTALIVYLLKSRRNRDFKFDWAEATRPIGETGLRLQYTHARLKSLELNHQFNAEDISHESILLSNFNTEYIENDPCALDLTHHLLRFEEAFWGSFKDFEPCILLNYLFRLCNKVSKALKELPVKNEKVASVSKTRLLLFTISRQVISEGMNVLGIQPLDQI